MRSFIPTRLILVLFAAAIAIGWTTVDRPKGDSTTIQRGDVFYVDEGSTIRVYRAGDSAHELVTSIETDAQATHDERRPRRKKHSHGVFSCSCTHSHDEGHRHHDHDDPHVHGVSTAQFVATGSTLSYVYDNSTVVTLDISTPDDPREVSRVDVGWVIESIEVIEAAVVIGGSQGRFALDTDPTTNALRKIE